MIELPIADPGRPDTRSPLRLLLWVGSHQKGTIAIAVTFGIVWMVSQALMPYAIGQAIQQGIVEGSNDALWHFCALLAALGILQAVSGIFRHRYAVQNWLQASFRLAQVVGFHAAHTGSAVREELSTGEVVATVSNDALRAGGAFDILARLAGGIVSYVVVAVILIAASPKLGLLVLLGVPLLTLSLTVVINPLQRRQREQREQVGRLTALGADTAAGLRVLRGVGGEQAFFDRYQRQSEDVRVAGVRVAGPQSTLDAAQVLLPGLFVVLVTWAGAHLAASGDITAGQLVSFYGYAGFLVIPLRTSAEAVEKISRALVGARRMLRVLAIERAVLDPSEPLRRAARGLAARRSGLRADGRRPACSRASSPRRLTTRARSRTGWAVSSTRRGCSSAGCRSTGSRSRPSAGESSSASPTLSSSPARSAASSTRGRRRPTARSRTRSRWPRPRTCSWLSPPGWTRRSTSAGGSSPAGSGSGSSSPGRCSRAPRSSCSSSPRAPSTRTPRRVSPVACTRTGPGAPRSS